MWFRWLPWRFLVSRFARAHGFIDPFHVLSLLERFSQPSEVAHPTELVRAGVVFHARGLMNTRVFQQNLDWVWPYWVSRQFDPNDESFIPRAFSITHVNLTHRNWTAVGLPDCNAYPIIDPAGLITPYFNGWSLDGWVITQDGDELIPSHRQDTLQQYVLESDSLSVLSTTEANGMRLQSQVSLQPDGHDARCEIQFQAQANRTGWLVVGLRPYNPEGVSFIHELSREQSGRVWRINKTPCVRFGEIAPRHIISTYHEGDIHRRLFEAPPTDSGHCEVGMITAAALFPIEAGQTKQVDLQVSMQGDREITPLFPARQPAESWQDALQDAASLKHPDPQFEALYERAVRTLIMHAPHEVYPGPYTYKRFWFRDAAFILHTMACIGLRRRVEHVLNTFPNKQRLNGYFASQEGEWDSNGEALWIMQRFCELSGCEPKRNWLNSIIRGARWIINKRLTDSTDEPHAGLLPAGFSAEHLGNNDYYYWDDFWGVAGLRAASALCKRWGDHDNASLFDHEAVGFLEAIERSLHHLAHPLEKPAIPASPYRRMDSGAVGSIVGSYPLNIWSANDPRIQGTLQFLRENCFYQGGFFQDMIHSGINAYLTLQIAQIMMRAGDEQFTQLIETIAELATQTGQWPEAIHPRTGGGCMGDGQHVWAAAEWAQIMRDLFVIEDHERLILGAGLADAWLEKGQTLHFGPTPTAFGDIFVHVEPKSDMIELYWQVEWRNPPAAVEVRLPGKPAATLDASARSATVARSGAIAESKA